MAATYGNEAIKQPVGNRQRLGSREVLSVIALTYPHSKIDL